MDGWQSDSEQMEALMDCIDIKREKGAGALGQDAGDAAVLHAFYFSHFNCCFIGMTVYQRLCAKAER